MIIPNLPRSSRRNSFLELKGARPVLSWARYFQAPAMQASTEVTADTHLLIKLGRERGRVVSAPDSQSGGPGFESRSGHLLDLCSVVPSLNSRPRL